MRPLTVPPEIITACRRGATLAVSISGGKDSQALLTRVSAWHRACGWTGDIFAVHADLGRTEWPQTAAHIERIAADAGVPLVVVRREQGDLLSRWEERMQKLAGTGKPFWSSAQNRYCTSDLKRGPINKELRKHQLVISVEGIRADESPTRARKPLVEMREAITSVAYDDCTIEEAFEIRDAFSLDGLQTLPKLALTWNAIHDWSKEDVWEACGTSSADLARRQQLYREGDAGRALEGWPAHPAYVYGNERLSCALCILASKNDLRNGARHNPELYQRLVEMERESGFTFRADMSLEDLEV